MAFGVRAGQHKDGAKLIPLLLHVNTSVRLLRCPK